MLTVASVDPAPTATSRRPTSPTSRTPGTGWPAARWRSTRSSRSGWPTRTATIRLGSDDDAPDVHVGAYAPQIPHDRHGRQHRLGRRHRDGHRQRPADLHRRHRPRDDPQAARAGSSARTPRSRCSTSPRARPRPRRPADRDPHRRHARQRGRHLPLPRSSAAAGSPRTPPGWRATSAPRRCRSSAASPATSDLFPQLRAALQECSSAAWPTRSTRTSTPAATTRASSPAPPRCPTTPSAWPSTSTSRQPARHRRRDGPRRGGDLQELGLRLGRRLALHRPDALRAERRWSTALSRSASLGPCAQSRSSRPPVPPTSRSATSRAHARPRTRCSSRCTASASPSPTCC